MRLTIHYVKTVSTPGRYTDDGNTGLSLLVKKSGSKSWTQRLRINGQRKDIGLGSVKDITLEKARSIAAMNKQSVLDGRTLGHTNDITFKDAAEKVIDNHTGWKNPKTRQNWQNVFEQYVYPAIGDVPVAKVNTGQVMDILLPLWNDKQCTAKKVRQRTSKVFRWAIAHGHRLDDPAGEALRAAMPAITKKVKHFKAQPHGQIAKTVEAIRTCTAYPITKLALEFTVLTACRSGEVRGARWSEIDLDNRVWTIPAARMKMGIDHQVPLPDRCMAILKEAQHLGAGCDLVFPSIRAKVLSDNTLSKLLRDNKIATTVHGFRSSFRDWAAECSSAPREIAEYCLAHIVGEGAELAYRRTDYFEKRRALMQQWGDYLAQ
ncbi:MAG: tyrosine-type recombinase/integrase [Proteobacteria bacterium]|nr:tyrosine-type recombinase/integrase [Pseudomonadota bacterium]